MQRLCVEALIKNGQFQGALDISELEALATSENKVAQVLTTISHAKGSNSTQLNSNVQLSSNFIHMQIIKNNSLTPC